MRRIVAIIALTLSLGGCASLPGSLGDAVRALTTTISNPVDSTNIYQVENAYAAALTVAVEYRRYCWSAPYKTLMADPVSRPVCERRRAVVRAIQTARRNAGAALVAAQNFIAQNPTLNAGGLVRAAWQAVTDFQAAIPVTK